ISGSGPNNGADLLPLLRAPGPGIACTDGSHFATIAASPGLAAGPGSTARGSIRMTACIVGWSHTPFGQHENDEVESNSAERRGGNEWVSTVTSRWWEFP